MAKEDAIYLQWLGANLRRLRRLDGAHRRRPPAHFEHTLLVTSGKPLLLTAA